MAKFTKTKNIKGFFKNVVIRENQFVDEDSGEVLDITSLLSDVYGETAFDITTSLKIDEEL